MAEPMSDEDLGELHIPATYAVAAGLEEVRVAPSDVVRLIDEVRRLRTELASLSTGTVGGGRPELCDLCKLAGNEEWRRCGGSTLHSCVDVFDAWNNGHAAGAAQRAREVRELPEMQALNARDWEWVDENVATSTRQPASWHSRAVLTSVALSAIRKLCSPPPAEPSGEREG